MNESNKPFSPVNPKVNFPEMEKQILEYWKENNILEKYLKKNIDSEKYYSFLDGPMTANNPMGVHHAWGRTYKDLWQKFKNMQGYKQRFQNGYDCQGLWVEVEVEKELGLRSKKDIENLIPGDKKASIAKFVQLCKDRVERYSQMQTQQSIRLGYFMDWDNSYYTLSEENNYMIWHFLKKCYDKGLIYRGHDSVPWCPRCGTAISQHEILTEDYKEISHQSIYLKYPIKDRQNESLLVWTTTPWTLPGNVAVAVDKDKEYAMSEIDGEIVYLLPSAAEKLRLTIKEKISGEKLVDLEYSSPFDELERIKNTFGSYKHKVIATDNLILPVSEEEGTGLIHIAPGCGSEDFQLGKKYQLPVIELIDEEAVYLDNLGEFSGQNAKKHPEIVLDYIAKINPKYILKIVPINHRYPACWRCKSELVWRVVDEWYISMDPLREPLKEVTKKINWIPKFGLKREIDWLDNMHDWLISKKRYWGLALPIWECSCGNFEVIGSKEELKDKAVLGWENFEGNTPHKPYIDEVEIKCSKCGENMKRISDVGNPWLDAGIVSFSTITKDNKHDPLYLHNKQEFEKWYPADFITESFPGQFKNWFYSLIAMSTVLENKEPTKNILGFGTLVGEDGKPMHKSWGNSIEFNEGADKIGVDVMRYMYARQNPAENMLFGYKLADDTRRRFHLILWNIYNFFVTYANIDEWKPKDIEEEKLTLLDKWILGRTTELLEKVTSKLEKYDAMSASGAIEEFVMDLSLWYIRRSRDRVGPSAEHLNEKESFYQTTNYVLITLSKVMAPFMPFISEEIYRNLTKEESVHLTEWPTVKYSVDSELIDNMALLREIVESVHSIRKEKQIPVRMPLSKLTSKMPKDISDSEIKRYLLEEVNVKEWVIEKSDSVDHVLDTEITPELEEESKTRELIRKIQEERKNLGMDLSQKINVKSEWIPTGDNLIKLKAKTVAENVTEGQFAVEKI